jgi:hypothetical protein
MHSRQDRENRVPQVSSAVADETWETTILKLDLPSAANHFADTGTDAE